MSDPKAWAIDISLVSDFSSDASGPVRLSLPSDLHLAPELRRGLDRGYATEEDNLATPRGKLVLSRHVAKNAAQKTRFFCRHDVLTEATQISVRLKQACRVLAARALPVAVVVKCQQVLALLGDVPDLRFVDLNRKLWTRDGRRALADELALIVREGLDLADASAVEASA